ncbi:MAG: alpha/beta fold hydrolase [Alphaproteobacteria bacterium]|nr:alpha/beta fold hydrolase [Alphaproteobacteria bacterium]
METTRPGVGFAEKHVEADGFRIRYCEAGDGPPLIHLHGAGGMRLNRAHDQLARYYRVMAFEMPGFGASPENTRSQSQAELAATMLKAADALRLDRFNLWGTSFGGRTALSLATQAPERVLGLVLEAPAAIRPVGTQPPSGSPDQMAALLYAHPERMPPIVPPEPAIAAKTRDLVMRLRGPDRDADLEDRLGRLPTPVLAIFGTRDRVIPAEMGRLYKRLVANCHLLLVYDAAHAIGAERPDAFTEAVHDFLQRHDAFVISRQNTVLFP